MSNATKVAAAIKALTSEHGAPNSFTAGEIALHAGLPPRTVGFELARRLISVSYHAGMSGKLSRDKRGGYTYVDVQA